LDAEADGRRFFRSPIAVADRVILMLVRLRLHVSWDKMTSMLNSPGAFPTKVSRQQISQVVANTAHVFARRILEGGLIGWPSLERLRKESQLKDVPDGHLPFIIDGTTLPTFEPNNARLGRSMWVAYKHKYGYRYFILTLASGRVVFVSSLGLGVDTDEKEYMTIKEPLRIFGESIKQLMLATEKLCIYGDKGYCFVEVPDKDWKLCVTKSGETEKARGSAQTETPVQDVYDVNNELEREFSTLFARSRSVVERTISKMKRWACLSDGLSRYKDNQQMLQHFTVIAAFFANLEIDGTLYGDKETAQ
jgi:DDE superfamily endonuclease